MLGAPGTGEVCRLGSAPVGAGCAVALLGSGRGAAPLPVKSPAVRDSLSFGRGFRRHRAGFFRALLYVFTFACAVPRAVAQVLCGCACAFRACGLRYRMRLRVRGACGCFVFVGSCLVFLCRSAALSRRLWRVFSSWWCSGWSPELFVAARPVSGRSGAGLRRLPLRLCWLLCRSRLFRAFLARFPGSPDRRNPGWCNRNGYTFTIGADFTSPRFLGPRKHLSS